MVEIHNDIKEETCDLYGPDEKLIGTIENELAFNDIRAQIRKNNLEGYYIIFRDKKYEITRSGRLFWPDGLFDKNEKLIIELL